MLRDFITVLREGEELANAETWKNRQIAVGALTALLGSVASIAHSLGYGPQVDSDTLGAIAAGVVGCVGLFNVWTTAATSKRVGILPARPPIVVGTEPPGGSA
jgi:hypothetical protein